MWLSVMIVFGFFLIAAGAQEAGADGVQNVAESTVDFVRNGIILQTMGEDGLRLHALPADDVQLHLRLQHLGDRPGRPDAGERPHRAAR